MGLFDNYTYKYKIDGFSNGQLYVYEDRVVFERKGALGFISHGLSGSKTIPISSITSVQYKRSGIAVGFIQFSIFGGKEKQGGVVAADKDENSITFRGSENNEAAYQIKKFIEEKIFENSKPKIVQQVVQTSSVADELIKLKSLLDDGIITKDEFDKQKDKLLK